MASNVALTGLASDLWKRSEAGNSIRIGLIGSGEMGTDIVARASLMPGIDVSAIADIRLDSATNAVDTAYQETGNWVIANSTDALNAAMERRKVAVVEDAILLIESGMIDVVVEATGLPGIGAELGLKAMKCGKHLVMMNVEADVTIGAYLKAQADKLGVVYSLGAGDEPSSCMELIEFVTAMGHRIVSAGKGKNNPLNVEARPDDYRSEADARGMNVRMLVEFVDGSKTMVEMAAIANATGLVPDRSGMHGPAVGPDELASTLIPQRDGGILSEAGRVDYSVGKGLAPGVFVVAEAEHPRIWKRMKDLKMGDGPYFSFIRPYHLTSLEVPLTCAKAVLHGKADMVPLGKPVAEVCALAKKELSVGEQLDQIGEYCYRGWIMEAEEARSSDAIPCGLLSGAVVTAPIPKGNLVTYKNATPPADSRLVQLRMLQDRMNSGTGRQE